MSLLTSFSAMELIPPMPTYLCRCHGNGNAQQKIRRDVAKTTAKSAHDQFVAVSISPPPLAEKIEISLLDVAVATQLNVCALQTGTSANGSGPGNRAHSLYPSGADARP